MKKIFNLAYVGAIALVCAGFSSCADDTIGKEVEPSPGYNAETNEVTADFVFNVSTGTNASTRMGSDAVQADINSNSAQLFRGIEKAKLFSYKVKNTNGSLKDGWHISYAPEVQPTVKLFDLGTVMSTGSLAPAVTDGTVTQSTRVVELNLPTETNVLMFYGKAIKTGTDIAQGSVEMDVPENGNMNNTFFRLNKIIPDGSDLKTKFMQSQTLIAAVLTKIIRTSYTTDAEVTVATDPTRKVASNKTFKWSDYVTITRDNSDNTIITNIVSKTSDPVIITGGSAVNMCALGEILANTYVTFNKIYNQGTHSELRAGAGPDITRMISDLYTVIATVKNAEPTNVEELIAKRLAKAICDNIDLCFDGSTGTWKENSSLKTFAGLSGAAVNQIDDDEKFTDFPKSVFNMPYGATILQITYNTTDNAPEYSYMGAVPTYAMGGTSGSTGAFDPSNWCFAPELMYFGNSPIKVTDATKSKSDYPDGTVNWTDSNNILLVQLLCATVSIMLMHC